MYNNKKSEDLPTINDLSKIRKIVSLIIDLLEKNITNMTDNNNIHLNEKNKELLAFLIGDKDNVVSVVNKLNNLLIKLIPLEQNMNKNIDNQNKESENSDNLEIIKRYIKKYGIILKQNNEKS